MASLMSEKKGGKKKAAWWRVTVRDIILSSLTFLGPAMTQDEQHRGPMSGGTYVIKILHCQNVVVEIFLVLYYFIVW